MIRPNESVELTATRRTLTFPMIKTVSQEATLAVCGRSLSLFSLDVMCTLRVATIVLLCAVSQDAFALDPPPTAAQLREWAAGPCVNAGKHAGIDYAHSLDRAIAGDPADLATLFRFTESGWCDGAAAEGHAAILFGLLQRLGDRPFSSVLRAQKRSVRKAVFDEIAAFPGWKPAEFPLTNATAPH
jgi:hypothetical protein